MAASKLYFSFSKDCRAYVIEKKTMYNNINQRFVNRKNRIQNFYNLLIIFLAADGGWPPAANFTLVEKITL